MYNGNFRHIYYIHNIVKQMLLNEIIYVNYLNSKKNITDMLTKSL
jgi:hypothetical protein